MSNITLKIGQSVAVTANIVDGYGVPAPSSQITWYSNSPGIAIITNNGFVVGTENTVSTATITGISNGTAVVTCAVVYGSNQSINNTINVTVASPTPSAIDFVIGTPV